MTVDIDVETTTGPRARGAGGPVLEVKDLHVSFDTEEGRVQAVRGVDLHVNEHEVLGIVGESGSGKSVTMLAVMGLLPRSATITGSIKYRGEELIGKRSKVARRYRGEELSMIFQDPLSALNPVLRVGSQIAEAIRAHRPDMGKDKVRSRVIELLEAVGIPEAEKRSRAYPHQFSGGMRQRAMIAMAIANDPDVLIADEPTTALDVTIQAQILDVLAKVQETTGTAIVFITHDLGVIARLAHRVQVLYAGRTAEVDTVDDLFSRPIHPYTLGLLNSLPKLEDAGAQLHPIAGSPPSMLHPPPACAFHPRCLLAKDVCREETPPLRNLDDGLTACHFAELLLAEPRSD